MTTQEVKDMIQSAKSIERESVRMQQEIEQRREELLSVKSAIGGERVMSSEKLSMPERVYFSLEKLYTQYSDVCQRLHDKRGEIEQAISTLDPIEQEIVRAWINGKTEEQIGTTVGYSRPTIARYKRRILVKLTHCKS
ncbi:MAG: hypothetical protein K2M89_06315 [Clostridiales bacterium]|nr:hypothetical protein [Clostridiales bacterium]